MILLAPGATVPHLLATKDTHLQEAKNLAICIERAVKKNHKLDLAVVSFVRIEEHCEETGEGFPLDSGARSLMHHLLVVELGVSG